MYALVLSLDRLNCTFDLFMYCAFKNLVTKNINLIVKKILIC